METGLHSTFDSEVISPAEVSPSDPGNLSMGSGCKEGQQATTDLDCGVENVQPGHCSDGTPSVTLRVPFANESPIEGDGSDLDSDDSEPIDLAACFTQSVQRTPFQELSQNNSDAPNVQRHPLRMAMESMKDQRGVCQSQDISTDCETEPITTANPWNQDYLYDVGPLLVHWDDMLKHIQNEKISYDLSKHETNVLWTFANEVNISFARGSGCYRMLGLKQNTKKPHLRCVLYLHVLESLKADDARNASALSTVQMLFGGQLKDGWGQVFKKRLTGSNIHHRRVLIGPEADIMWSFCPQDVSFYALKLRNREIASLQAALPALRARSNPPPPFSLAEWHRLLSILVHDSDVKNQFLRSKLDLTRELDRGVRRDDFWKCLIEPRFNNPRFRVAPIAGVETYLPKHDPKERPRAHRDSGKLLGMYNSVRSTFTLCMQNYNASGQLEDGATEFRKFLPGAREEGDTLNAEAQRVMLLFLALGVGTSGEHGDLLSIVSKAAPEGVHFNPEDGEEAAAYDIDKDVESTAPTNQTTKSERRKRRKSSASEALESYREMWQEIQRANREAQRTIREEHRAEQRVNRECLKSLFEGKNDTGAESASHHETGAVERAPTVLEFRKVSAVIFEAEKDLENARKVGARKATLEILEQAVEIATEEAQKMLKDMKAARLNIRKS